MLLQGGERWSLGESVPYGSFAVGWHSAHFMPQKVIYSSLLFCSGPGLSRDWKLYKLVFFCVLIWWIPVLLWPQVFDITRVNLKITLNLVHVSKYYPRNHKEGNKSSSTHKINPSQHKQILASSAPANVQSCSCKLFQSAEKENICRKCCWRISPCFWSICLMSAKWHLMLLHQMKYASKSVRSLCFVYTWKWMRLFLMLKCTRRRWVLAYSRSFIMLLTNLKDPVITFHGVKRSWTLFWLLLLQWSFWKWKSPRYDALFME